jgi:hypothetical protein
MDEALAHRPFSTNTPLGSGRFCYHLFRAEQRRTGRRRAPLSQLLWGSQLLDCRIPLTFTSYAISCIHAQHLCFATIPIQQTSPKLLLSGVLGIRPKLWGGSVVKPQFSAAIWSPSHIRTDYEDSCTSQWYCHQPTNFYN